MVVVVMGLDGDEMRGEGEMCIEERTRSFERREGMENHFSTN
jgi:hypothetical protein